MNDVNPLRLLLVGISALAIIPGCTAPENRIPIDPIALDDVVTDVERLGWSKGGLATIHQ